MRVKDPDHNRRRTFRMMLVICFLASGMLAGGMMVRAAMAASIAEADVEQEVDAQDVPGAPLEPEVPPTPEELEQILEELKLQWHENEQIGKTEIRLHRKANRIRSALCKQGMLRHCSEYASLQGKNIDIDKLAHAVAVAETGNCTAGTGRSHLNNCFGIRVCHKGQCSFKHYASREDSYADFKRIWLTKYGDRFPTLADARRYSAGEGTSWLERVTVAYNRK